MENRDRDLASQRTTPTDTERLKRSVEEEKGREVNRGSSAEFGQSIGRSEKLTEGGEMRNRNQDEVTNDRSMENESSRKRGMENESTRKPGSSGYGSSSGRSSGSSEEIDRSRSERERPDDISDDDRSSRRGSSNELGSRDSSEGRH